MDKKKVLIIDDEDFIRELIRDFLELDNVSCAGAETPDRAMEMLRETTYDLILLDRYLGKKKAEDLIPKIREHCPHIPIVILTGDQRCDDHYTKEIGADGIIFKPFQVNEFMENVKKFLEL